MDQRKLRLLPEAGWARERTKQEGTKEYMLRREAKSRARDSPDSVTIMGAEERETPVEFYCPRCHCAVQDPLVCGDCSAIICRRCGTPLERVDELGIG